MQISVIVLLWFRRILTTCGLLALVSIGTGVLLGFSVSVLAQAIFAASLGVPIATWIFRMDQALSLRQTLPYVICSVPVVSLLVYISFLVDPPAAPLPKWLGALLFGAGPSLAGLLPNVYAFFERPKDESAP